MSEHRSGRKRGVIVAVVVLLALSGVVAAASPVFAQPAVNGSSDGPTNGTNQTGYERAVSSPAGYEVPDPTPNTTNLSQSDSAPSETTEGQPPANASADASASTGAGANRNGSAAGPNPSPSPGEANGTNGTAAGGAATTASTPNGTNATNTTNDSGAEAAATAPGGPGAAPGRTSGRPGQAGGGGLWATAQDKLVNGTVMMLAGDFNEVYATSMATAMEVAFSGGVNFDTLRFASDPGGYLSIIWSLYTGPMLTIAAAIYVLLCFLSFVYNLAHPSGLPVTECLFHYVYIGAMAFIFAWPVGLTIFTFPRLLGAMLVPDPQIIASSIGEMAAQGVGNAILALILWFVLGATSLLAAGIWFGAFLLSLFLFAMYPIVYSLETPPNGGGTIAATAATSKSLFVSLCGMPFWGGLIIFTGFAIDDYVVAVFGETLQIATLAVMPLTHAATMLLALYAPIGIAIGSVLGVRGSMMGAITGSSVALSRGSRSDSSSESRSGDSTTISGTVVNGSSSGSGSDGSGSGSGSDGSGSGAPGDADPDRINEPSPGEEDLGGGRAPGTFGGGGTPASGGATVATAPGGSTRSSGRAASTGASTTGSAIGGTGQSSATGQSSGTGRSSRSGSTGSTTGGYAGGSAGASGTYGGSSISGDLSARANETVRTVRSVDELDQTADYRMGWVSEDGDLKTPPGASDSGQSPDALFGERGQYERIGGAYQSRGNTFGEEDIVIQRAGEDTSDEFLNVTPMVENDRYKPATRGATRDIDVSNEVIREANRSQH